MTPEEITKAIEDLRKEGALPPGLTQRSVQEMAKSMAKYCGDLSRDKVAQFAAKAREVAEAALKVTEAKPISVPEAPEGVAKGGETATARGLLQDFIDAPVADSMNLEFFLRVPMEVAQGAGKWARGNLDPAALELFPAMELRRVYPRVVPRGSEKDPAGPENAWDDDDGRWPAACEEAGDDDARKVFDDTGRMVALKSSGVWQALGDGAGGYDDTLGSPFSPFAFNSGMDTDEVGRDECEDLGLLDEGDEVEAPEMDLAELFGLSARCALNASQRALEATASSSSKGCLMAMVDQNPEQFTDWSNENIPAAALAGEIGGEWFGIEGEPHVTVFYGFNLGFDTDKLQSLVKTYGPVKFKLGKVSRFECKDYDVLKVDVSSVNLSELNALIAKKFSKSVTPSEHDYHAHLTLAYVKKGWLPILDGNKDFDGDVITVTSLLFSEPDKTNHRTIELDREAVPA